MNIKNGLILEVKNQKTNRPIIHSDSRNPTDAYNIHQFIINYVEHDTKDLENFIDLLVKKFDCRADLPNQIFYKGIDKSKTEHLQSKLIGPSPDPVDNRYSTIGEKCLYLIDKCKFLFEEIKPAPISICVQEYNIPLNEYKIADLSPNNKNLHNSLALAFDMAERGITSSGYLFEEELRIRDKSRYKVSQLLSSLFIKYGWEGLYIPGVHGIQDRHYHNLAIFSSIIDKWTKWAKGSYFPIKR
ncbi:MAG: hypothetical protein HOC71_02235 [Candidatus Latescibacteria bacterium]|jgi:hypothetical protein|nr:hypothetical protein [Candidatus Latescibacterota bacterium]